MENCMRQGFVKLPRSLAESEAWGYGATVRGILATLFLDAAWKPMNVRGVRLKRGEYLASVAYLAKDTGLSSKTVRIALSRLADAGVITMHSEGKKGTRITICDYGAYDEKPEPKGEESSEQSSQQSNHNRRSKDSEEANINPPIPPHGDNGGSSKTNNWKKWDSTQFAEAILEANYDQMLTESECQDFHDYWMEPDVRGRTRLALEKTWDTRRRMRTALKMVFSKERATRGDLSRGKTLDELMEERKL